jgi:hypothetical protein
MNIRRVLAVAAIPFVIGTFGFLAPGQANATNPSNRIAQIAQQPHRPQDGPQRPNVNKAQVKHRQPRPQLKKRPPQPPQHHNKSAEQNWGRPNNR